MVGGDTTASRHDHRLSLSAPSDCWGKGIGLDAWSTLLDYLLNVCCLRKVTGGTLRCNVGMVRIMERSGMQLEAVRVQQELVDQVAHDALYYAKFRAA